METISQFIILYSGEIMLVIILLSILAIILTLINYIRTTKIIKKYKKMMRGMDNKNIEYMLNDHLENMDKVNQKVHNLDNDVKLVLNQLGNCIQRVGIVRYNPFDEVGSDQSFSVALLDSKGDGVVFTGLYTRKASSVFAKPLIDSQSKYPLSEEEKRAIRLTLK